MRHKITVQGKNIVTVTDEVPQPLRTSSDIRTQMLATPNSYQSKPLLNKVNGRFVINSYQSGSLKDNSTFNTNSGNNFEKS